eukprot:TRINITY_DN12921_c0_g2_i1.p2 TRINITY_DN12921_c0_g2~~TRINITY_DN12921_c0_g2_i1.p2  ORF type:complete len:122 (+),score=12.98 TRINITY_DN12921_c0_g2_i1:287-652(+)
MTDMEDILQKQNMPSSGYVDFKNKLCTEGRELSTLLQHEWLATKRINGAWIKSSLEQGFPEGNSGNEDASPGTKMSKPNGISKPRKAPTSRKKKQPKKAAASGDSPFLFQTLKFCCCLMLS